MYNNDNVNYNENSLRTLDPYNKNTNYFRQNRRYNNNYDLDNFNLYRKFNINSPFKFASDSILPRPTKTKRFQNENLVVYRVSPYHYQYKYKVYDDMYKNNANNYSQNINRMKNTSSNDYNDNNNNFNNNNPPSIKNVFTVQHIHPCLL